MNLYAIIGYPLGHSCSPKYFNEKFRQEGIEAEYVSFEIEDIKQLPDLLKRNPTLQGFNVTIPHKQSILPYLHEISEEAQAIGAVNCVRISKRNERPYLTGYNTDMYGFRKALIGFIPTKICKALILGNGRSCQSSPLCPSFFEYESAHRIPSSGKRRRNWLSGSGEIYS